VTWLIGQGLVKKKPLDLTARVRQMFALFVVEYLWASIQCGSCLHEQAFSLQSSYVILVAPAERGYSGVTGVTSSHQSTCATARLHV